MSAQANPRLALRPMLPADAPLLAEIFRESVLELTGEDYSTEQQEAWAAKADVINCMSWRELQAFLARKRG